MASNNTKEHCQAENTNGQCYVAVQDTVHVVNMPSAPSPPAQIVYTQQPQTIHTTIVTKDSSEPISLLLLIFGIIFCCPILYCINVALYRHHDNPRVKKYADVSLILAIIATLVVVACLILMFAV